MFYVVAVNDKTVTIQDKEGIVDTFTYEELWLLRPLAIQGVKYLKTKVSATTYKGMDIGELYVKRISRRRGSATVYTICNILNGTEVGYGHNELRR